MNKFISEFNTIFDNQVVESVYIFLLDLLEDLKFVDTQFVTKHFSYIENLINDKGL